MRYFRLLSLAWTGRASLAVALGLVALGQAAGAAARRPNILFIMADDLGWMDLACQGNPLVETPNIDRLARQGMRFTSAYAAAPVCSPTRAAVLTGQAPARVHMTSHLPGQFFPKDNRPQPADMVPAIGPEHITIAERLKEAGYANAFLGKWHIAPSAGPRGKVAPEHSPLSQGFDINIGGGSYGGPPSFFSPYRNATLPDGEPGEYLPDRLVDETIDFIRDHKSKPWMVHLWFYTVHWPMQAPKELLKKYADRTGPGLNDTRYGAMIEAMDLAVGRLLASLEAMGLNDETLVVFTSDNGGFAGVSDCRPLRESKGHLYEGRHSRADDRALAGAGEVRHALRRAGGEHGFLPDIPRGRRSEADYRQTSRRRESGVVVSTNRQTQARGVVFSFSELRLAHGQPAGRRCARGQPQVDSQLR